MWQDNHPPPATIRFNEWQSLRDNLYSAGKYKSADLLLPDNEKRLWGLAHDISKVPLYLYDDGAHTASSGNEQSATLLFGAPISGWRRCATGTGDPFEILAPI